MTFRLLTIAGLGAALAIALPAQSQAPKPPAAFTTCATCHATVAGRPSPMGPNLFGVAGRVSGTVPKFNYSPAMKKAAIKWDAATLDALIAGPRAAVPGTIMPDLPVKDAAKRNEIVSYLLSLK